MSVRVYIQELSYGEVPDKITFKIRTEFNLVKYLIKFTFPTCSHDDTAAVAPQRPRVLFPTILSDRGRRRVGKKFGCGGYEAAGTRIT